MQRILGIDAGIASVGFALVEVLDSSAEKTLESLTDVTAFTPKDPQGRGRIAACGSHIFDAAEHTRKTVHPLPCPGEVIAVSGDGWIASGGGWMPSNACWNGPALSGWMRWIG